jgi:hypothetical protein
VSLQASAAAAASVSIALRPADQTRGWRRRWQEAERDLAELLAPRTDAVSGEGIHTARHDLHSFYVQTYHLKDALKDEAGATGVPGATIETTVTNEPALALLADLANLDKHGQLKNPPRSGHVPVVASVAGSTVDASPGSWRLRLVVKHAGKTLDGLELARDAVDAWRRHLTDWGLI